MDSVPEPTSAIGTQEELVPLQRADTVMPKTRLSSSERRQAIIQAALSLFAEKGFRGVTTRELAAAVGVTEPVLYQHFKTKSDLFRALVETQCQLPQTATELQELMGNGDDEGFFRTLARAILDWYLDDPRFAKLLMHSLLDKHELAELFFETHVARFNQIIEAHVAARMEAGAFRKGNAMMTAQAFVGMVAHFGLMGAVHPAHCQARHIVMPPREEIVEQMVSTFLNGLLVTTPVEDKAVLLTKKDGE